VADLRLNLGCGRDIREGWVNIDCSPVPGVDHVVDFDDKPVLPFGDDSVMYSEGSHVIEHLRDPLPFMEELWRVTRPGAKAVFRCPYGSTDDADEDPTHVRRMFAGSWGYFGQPHYWRAQYNTKDEYDAFGRRLHPAALCPWHVPEPLSSDGYAGLDRPDPGQEAERPGAVLEGRLPDRNGSARSHPEDPGAPARDGDSSWPQAVSMGERPPQERPGGRQLLEQFGTLVQDAASRSESRGFAELARILIPERIAPAPELGEQGCTCTRADYGYQGDWQPVRIVLEVFPGLEECTDPELNSMIRFQRNIVAEMTATLRCVKPRREAALRLQEPCKVTLRRG